MATTRLFKKTAKDRVGRDASFRHALLGEIEDGMRAGDMAHDFSSSARSIA